MIDLCLKESMGIQKTGDRGKALGEVLEVEAVNGKA